MIFQTITPARPRFGPDARQDWVHEHAETGSPLAASRLRAVHGEGGVEFLLPRSVVRAGGCSRVNGPAALSGLRGHNLSAHGSPSHAACSAATPPSRRASRKGRPPLGTPHTCSSQVIPLALSRPFPPRIAPFPLAAGPGSPHLPGRKVRWQRKFASLPRRIRPD